jgi:tubulin monoglycylase TTLL3/8
MIDRDWKCWLIEANTNPCLALSSSYLAKIIPAMLENTFKLTIDLLFP